MTLAEQLAQLRQVNSEINAYPYRLPQDMGEPADQIEDIRTKGFGDCADYMITKILELRARGWPSASLRPMACRTEPLPDYPNGEMHAVLSVEVTGDDGAPQTWILDNRIPDVYPWNNPPQPANLYKWVERRTPSGDWEDVSNV